MLGLALLAGQHLPRHEQAEVDQQHERDETGETELSVPIRTALEDSRMADPKAPAVTIFSIRPGMGLT